MDGNQDEVRKEAAVQTEQKDAEIKPNGTALFPFIVFVGVYLGAGIILQMQGVEMPFYQFPAPLASIIGIIVAFALLKGKFSDKFNTFIEGCGNPDILIMCMIFLLAGGFAVVCKAMGGIDSTVNLGLTYIPPQYFGGRCISYFGFHFYGNRYICRLLCGCRSYCRSYCRKVRHPFGTGSRLSYRRGYARR